MKNNMTITEIRKAGFDALNKKLGIDGMLRFMQQFDSGSGDYTKKRKQMLDSFTLDDIRKELKK